MFEPVTIAIPAHDTTRPCESCHRHQAVVTVGWSPVDPFRVCAGCAPDHALVATA